MQAEALIDLIPDAVFTKDLEGRYTFINAAGARFLGRTVAEVLGKTDVELLGEQNADLTLRRDRGVLTLGTTTSYEDAEVLDGSPRFWLSTKGPLKSEDGDIAGLLESRANCPGRRERERARMPRTR